MARHHNLSKVFLSDPAQGNSLTRLHKKLLKFKVLSEKLGGRSRSSVCRDIKLRGFPAPITIGRSVAWDEEAVDKWLEQLADTPYMPEPVAIPAPGKQRGRPAKTNYEQKYSNSDLIKDELPTNPNIDKFKNAMRKQGITPPNEVIADGELHHIDANGNNSTSGSGWYILNIDNPIIGLYGCEVKKISKRWTNKKSSSLNIRESKEYAKKLKAMRAKRNANKLK